MLRLLSRRDAALWMMRYYRGQWSLHLYECPECGEASTWLLKCRAKVRSPCRRLPMYHVHHVCIVCGYVWLTVGHRL